MLKRFCDRTFSETYTPNIGCDFLTKTILIENEKIKLVIWDIGGQQRFEYIRSTFYKGAAGVLLVFDPTRKQTYTEARDYLNEIRHFTGEIPFVLIGNKVYLLDLDNEALLREQARKFARNESGIYIEASPTSIDIIENAFRELTRRIIDFRLPN